MAWVIDYLLKGEGGVDDAWGWVHVASPPPTLLLSTSGGLEIGSMGEEGYVLCVKHPVLEVLYLCQPPVHVTSMFLVWVQARYL